MLLMGQTLQEIMTARDTLTYFVSKFGVCHKSEKVNPTTNETIGISRVTVKYKGNHTLSRKKTESYNSTMSRRLISTQNFCFKLEKVNSPTFVNTPSYIVRKNSISFSPTGANIKSEKVGELRGVYYSWEISQTKNFFGG